MGDDVTVVIPTEEEPEDTYDVIGQQLVDLLSTIQSRLDNLVIQIGDLNARIALVEGLCGEIGGRVWAPVDHTHEEFALAGHDHDERYASIDHTHEAPHKERDTPPEKQHLWFRKLGT